MSSDIESSSGIWSPAARELAGEALEMLQLRRELAELEVRHDLRTGRRLLIVGGAGLVFLLSGLPLLLVAAARGLATWTNLGQTAWLLILGAVSLLWGGTVMWAAYRRFRQDFSGLEGTLAELNEDLVWLQDWTSRAGEGDR